MILIDLDLIFSQFDRPVSNYIIGSLTIIRHFNTPKFQWNFFIFQLTSSGSKKCYLNYLSQGT